MPKSTFFISRFKSDKSDNYDKIITDIHITYGYAQTKFGQCLVGLKDDTLCFLSFVGDEYPGIEALRTIYPKAALSMNNDLISRKVQRLFDDTAQGVHIKLLLKGTDFEVKVWEHLVKLQRGTTTSYEDVAKAIGRPKAIRAVARAVAKNNISYFVPCHRVIAKKNIGGYRWGVDRKKKMLQDEMKVAKERIIDKLWKNSKTVRPIEKAVEKIETIEILD